MKKISKFVSLVLLVAASQLAHCQDFYENYSPTAKFDSTAVGSVSLHFYNNNFIRNNEYFGPFTEGITYLGNIVQPEATWAMSKELSLSAGWYLRHYFGQDGFEQSMPVLRVRYNPTPSIQVVFGQLDGRLKHGYLEPIYNTDNYFIKNPEYGVQLKVDKSRLHTDVYMDWEKFLMPGEAHKEIITAGLLSSYRLSDGAKDRGFSLHFQSIIHHFGGQVDKSTSPLQSRGNVSLGISYAILPASIMVKKLTLSSHYIQALELSQYNTIPFKSGYGIQSTLAIENDWIKVNSSWFHGEYYFAPMGDFLFQSLSQFNDWYIVEKRDLITSKFLLGHQIMKGVNFGIRFESYYDIQRKSDDFSYGLNISVNAKVFEKKISTAN